MPSIEGLITGGEELLRRKKQTDIAKRAIRWKISVREAGQRGCFGQGIAVAGIRRGNTDSLSFGVVAPQDRIIQIIRTYDARNWGYALLEKHSQKIKK